MAKSYKQMQRKIASAKGFSSVGKMLDDQTKRFGPPITPAYSQAARAADLEGRQRQIFGPKRGTPPARGELFGASESPPVAARSKGTAERHGFLPASHPLSNEARDRREAAFRIALNEPRQGEQVRTHKEMAKDHLIGESYHKEEAQNAHDESDHELSKKHDEAAALHKTAASFHQQAYVASISGTMKDQGHYENMKAKAQAASEKADAATKAIQTGPRGGRYTEGAGGKHYLPRGS